MECGHTLMIFVSLPSLSCSLTAQKLVNQNQGGSTGEGDRQRELRSLMALKACLLRFWRQTAVMNQPGNWSNSMYCDRGYKNTHQRFKVAGSRREREVFFSYSLHSPCWLHTPSSSLNPSILFITPSPHSWHSTWGSFAILPCCH